MSALFGGCACRQGRDECNCGLLSDIEPIEQDLPMTPRNIAIALAIIAISGLLWQFAPWGIL